MEPRQAAIETYRYLRVGIVALALLLAMAVVGEIVVGDAGLLGSISAYYFTPVRDVFVGVLVALGLGLIVIRGRGVEDVLLNLAGMLAPVVAFVPTPVTDSVRSSLGSTPAPTADAMWALIALGVPALAFAVATARRLDGDARTAAMRGAAAGAVTVVGFGVWLGIDDQSFLQAAHYAAAVGMFGVFVVVARLNAVSARDDVEGPVVAMLPAQRRRTAYATISWSMLGTVVVAGLLGLLQLTGSTPVPHWLFWVESILLALFAAFWALQTIEYWRDGVPLMDSV